MTLETNRDRINRLADRLADLAGNMRAQGLADEAREADQISTELCRIVSL